MSRLSHYFALPHVEGKNVKGKMMEGPHLLNALLGLFCCALLSCSLDSFGVESLGMLEKLIVSVSGPMLLLVGVLREPL